MRGNFCNNTYPANSSRSECLKFEAICHNFVGPNISLLLSIIRTYYDDEWRDNDAFAIHPESILTDDDDDHLRARSNVYMLCYMLYTGLCKEGA